MNSKFDYDLLSAMMTNANMGWWEADLKTESYICSEYISRLLGLDEDGTISFKAVSYTHLVWTGNGPVSLSIRAREEPISYVYMQHTRLACTAPSSVMNFTGRKQTGFICMPNT